MKTKVYSFSEWDKDGLLEIHVDEVMLIKIVHMYESMVDSVINNDCSYNCAFELLKDRNDLVEKLEELKNGKSAD